MKFKTLKKETIFSTLFTALILLSVFSLYPAVSWAQTIDQMFQEGSTEPTYVRQERIRGYRQQSNDFQQKINMLPSTANPVVSMPVLFGVALTNIAPNFGDPRSGGRTHEGEDIMAVKGTPIVSPTPAVVLRTGVGATEGNYVYTANPGGETFVYMHLDRIGEGVVSGFVLAQGALIGYVGNTGNASGGAAHLHFEIHNSSGTPTDPFPRLKGELTLAEKMADLSTIFTQTIDGTALAQLLVINFRSTFTAAISVNISLPIQITSALATIPAGTTPTSGNTSLPAGDLAVGSSGSLVNALQQYLIQSASGSAATNLSYAGATGYFGAITKSALLEFQIAKNIIPTNGYYGSETRLYVIAHPLGTVIVPPSSGNPPVTSGITAITRNLYKSISGEDVRALQKFLNTHGYIVATNGVGSLGNETNYFGTATESAVIKFQIAHSIIPAVGYVGPVTRTTLGSL